MKDAAVLAPNGCRDALLTFENASQAGSACALALLAEAPADGLHQLVGDDQVPVGALPGPVEGGCRPGSDLSGRNTASTSVSAV